LVFLKTNNFDTSGSEAALSRPCACPLEFSGVIRNLFDACYRPRELYRATGVILLNLAPDENIQYNLFDNPVHAEKIKDLYHVADELGQKFGKHTVHLGSTHLIEKMGKGRRGSPTVREQTILKGETRRRHLALPLIHVIPS
jgi:DNA polymerase-4/DNA polymerase V